MLGFGIVCWVFVGGGSGGPHGVGAPGPPVGGPGPHGFGPVGGICNTSRSKHVFAQKMEVPFWLCYVSDLLSWVGFMFVFDGAHNWNAEFCVFCEF